MIAKDSFDDFFTIFMDKNDESSVELSSQGSL